MSIVACRTCGLEVSLPTGQEIMACPACGTHVCRPQAEANVGDMLRRATTQRLRCDFIHAESSYQYVLRESPDAHEALWGLVQCRYAVEYVRDPRTGKPMPIVHAVRARPMLADPDFREACDLAPEDVRAQYRQEAEYIDDAMMKIIALAEAGDGYDVFLCHKTSRTDGEEGYTEDYNRAVQLYIMLIQMGYKVFCAPFSGLTPGEEYEAGIYHAISTAKVMLVVCSSQDYINSPWVRTEWQRFLEMSWEAGSDKHLIPLLYGDFPPRRLPDDFRRLQAIVMGELNAKDTLVTAVRTFVSGKAEAAQPQPASAFRAAPEPVAKPRPAAPVQPAAAQPASPRPATVPGRVQPVVPRATVEKSVDAQTYKGVTESNPASWAERPGAAAAPVSQIQAASQSVPKGETPSSFATVPRMGGVEIVRYKGVQWEVVIPKELYGKPVIGIGERAFEEQKNIVRIEIPEGVRYIGPQAFLRCGIREVKLPASLVRIAEDAFWRCSRLQTVTVAEGNPMYRTQDGVLVDSRGTLCLCPVGLGLKEYTVPETIRRIGGHAFSDNEELCRVVLPQRLTEIGMWAFAECWRLRDVQLPQSLDTIDKRAFSQCSMLARLELPDGIAQLDAMAFEDCGARLIVRRDSVTHDTLRRLGIRCIPVR